MAIAKKTAKKPAVKPAVKRAPAKKTVAKKPVARRPAVKARKSAPASKAIAGTHDLSVATSKFLANGRKDLEALLKVNKHSYSELQDLVKRRTSLLKDAIRDWQSVAKSVDVHKPLDSVGKFEELGKEAFKLALENIRELADLAAKSQAEAFKVVKKSIEDNVSEVSKLLKK